MFYEQNRCQECFSHCNNEVESVRVQFFHYKNNYNQRPFSLVISRQSSFCPVEYLLKYLQQRGLRIGALFVMPDGSPVSRSFFTDKLTTALRYGGLDPAKYKAHSFRIGAASYAAERGMSDAQIRAMGRWKSNAFQKYIRIQSLTQ